MIQHYPIDDADFPDVSAEQVLARIENWLDRLHELFASIKTWAEREGWLVEDRAPVPMQEALMSRMSLPERPQPSLSIRSSSGAEIWIKPKGLWVIGANGRVDLYSRKGAFTIVDVAEPLEKANWVLYKVGSGNGRPFNPNQLADLI